MGAFFGASVTAGDFARPPYNRLAQRRGQGEGWEVEPACGWMWHTRWNWLVVGLVRCSRLLNGGRGVRLRVVLTSQSAPIDNPDGASHPATGP